MIAHPSVPLGEIREHVPEGPLRVLIAVRPQLFRDSLREVLDQDPELDVVGESDADGFDLLASIVDREPDVLIHGDSNGDWRMEGGLPPIMTHVLNEFPNLIVLGLIPQHHQLVQTRLELRQSWHPLRTARDLRAALCETRKAA